MPTTATAKRIEPDYYHSRDVEMPEMVRRDDPVIWGKPQGGLTPAERDAYEKNGYLHLEALLEDTEIACLMDEVNHLKNKHKLLPSDYVIRERGTDAIRSFFYVHHYSEAIRKLAAHPKLLAMAREILGGDVYLHQSRVNLKPGFKGKEFYWHSDFETWHVEDGMPRMRAFSCSISLTDNTPNNGPLMVIPGSHMSYIRCVGETPEDHYKKSLVRQEYGVPDELFLSVLAKENGIDAPIGRAGSATLFDCNLMHGSNSNITPFARTNIFFVYNSVQNRLNDPYGPDKPRPEHIAARQHMPVLK